jgi:hypothetical protein
MANLKNITELPVAESAEGLNLIVNDNGSAKQIAASAVGAQADFAVTDETSPAFIKNKPEVAQTDWAVKDEANPAHLKNKPFYDTREYDNITLTFDGDVTGKEVFYNGASYAVKLSDKVPSKEELIGASVSLVQGGETLTIEVASDMIQDDGNGNLAVADAYMVVPDSLSMTNDNGTFTLSRGVWGVCAVENGVTLFYTKELSWYGLVSGELKKIEEKYIPGLDEWDLDITVNFSFDSENGEPIFEPSLNAGTFNAVKDKILANEKTNIKVQTVLPSPEDPSIIGYENNVIYTTLYAPQGLLTPDSPETIMLLYHSWASDGIMEINISPDNIEVYPY